MSALLLALALSAAPPVVLVHPPLDAAGAAELGRVEEAFRARGFAVLPRATVAQVIEESAALGVACRDPADGACFVKLGLAADAARVVVPFGARELAHFDVATGASTRARVTGDAYDAAVAVLLGEAPVVVEVPAPAPPVVPQEPASSTKLYAGIGAGVAGALAAGSFVGALVVESQAQGVVDRWRTDPSATLDELPGLEAAELTLFGVATVATVATAGALATFALAE